MQASPPLSSQQDFCSKSSGFPAPGWGRGGTPGLGALQARLCLQGGGRALSTQPQDLPGSVSRFGARREGQTLSSSLEVNEEADFGVPHQEGGI